MVGKHSHKAAIDLPKLWKWVQFYTNNWRLSPTWTQAVLSALSDCYWAGIISWADFIKCQQLFSGRRPSQEIQLGVRADDLALAISQIGTVVQGRFLIDDICGFIDQGVVLQAEGERTERLLCLTIDEAIVREITRQIPVINQLDLPFIINVRSVIKERDHLYLVLSPFTGQSLPSWLITQYPTGLPRALAQNILKQIYDMLVALREEPQLIASIHPGQLFIDPETLTVQLLPFAVPAGYTLPRGMRARVYQAPNILSIEDDESFLGYHFLAIAYELFTACVPDANHKLMGEVIKNCEGINRNTKRQMEYCLLRQMDKAITLSQAAMILDVAKKRPILDASLMIIVGLFALSAITWQGLRYAPHILAEGEVAPQTIVIQQDVKDSHVNFLKAAFFTQTEQVNIAGARASWQALQQLLPDEDIFVAIVGPQQLASSYIVAAERMMRQDPQAAGVLVRAAIRLVPQVSLPAHTQALAMLPAPILAEASHPPIAVPEDELSDEILALTTTMMESLPPLPAVSSYTSAQADMNVASIDPCLDALIQQNKTAVSCMDTVSDLHFGPRLTAVRTPWNHAFVITQEAISVADYNQYCSIAGTCVKTNQASNGSLDLALNDIEQTVHDYNNYCLVSSLCEPLDVPVEPIVSLAPAQIAAYTAWLSEKTGFTYRL
ncbi:MAG TPA: hypothetical protein VI522_01965, partial [Gammaproteobacteria bacterium]|nr:hypothetical protein [Gammaproteobacteria bacterium]